MWVVNKSGNAPLRPWQRGGIDLARAGHLDHGYERQQWPVAPSHPTSCNCWLS